MKKQIIFLMLLTLLVVPLVNADFFSYCGGDNQLIQNCFGDEENVHGRVFVEDGNISEEIVDGTQIKFPREFNLNEIIFWSVIGILAIIILFLIILVIYLATRKSF